MVAEVGVLVASVVIVVVGFVVGAPDKVVEVVAVVVKLGDVGKVVFVSPVIVLGLPEVMSTSKGFTIVVDSNIAVDVFADALV